MKGSKEERKKASTKEGRKKDSTVTNPQVWSLVEGPKSTYMPRRSPSHMPRSLLPRNGLEASLSSKVITSAPEERVGGGVSKMRDQSLHATGFPGLLPLQKTKPSILSLDPLLLWILVTHTHTKCHTGV